MNGMNNNSYVTRQFSVHAPIAISTGQHQISHAVLLVLKLQLRDTGSWSFHVCIPKLELGNEYKNYTSTIGYELWLIGGEQKIDSSTWQPVLSSYLQAGHPVIVWNKGKASAVEIWVDRTNDNNFVLLSVNTKPNVTDLTPLPAGGSGALWKYKAIYHLDDQPVGLWSNIISVTVGV